MNRLVALGDSFSCGEGVGVRTDPEQTWSARLARGMGLGYRVLAEPGARIRDVRAKQVPAAVTSGATFASVLVGLNDLIRGDFRPAQLEEDLLAVVRELRASGMTVLLCRLHDPLAQLRGQRALAAVRAPLARRVAAVNDAVDMAAGADPGVRILDLAAQAALHERECWAIDRLHPADRGHEVLATAALQAVGYRDEAPSPAATPEVAVLAELRWLVRHALPWTATHVGPVVLPAARMVWTRGHGGQEPTSAGRLSHAVTAR